MKQITSKYIVQAEQMIGEGLNLKTLTLAGILALGSLFPLSAETISKAKDKSVDPQQKVDLICKDIKKGSGGKINLYDNSGNLTKEGKELRDALGERDSKEYADEWDGMNDLTDELKKHGIKINWDQQLGNVDEDSGTVDHTQKKKQSAKKDWNKVIKTNVESSNHLFSKTLLSYRKFEEGDKVTVKNVERKGTVKKEHGSFYDVELDPAPKKNETYVDINDMVKASRKLFSRFFNDFPYQSLKLADIAQYMACFYFDMRTIHFLAVGSDFLSIHEFAQEIYESAEKWYDDLVETAIGYNEPYQPMCVLPGDWELAQKDSFSEMNDFVDGIRIRCQRMFDILECLEKGNYASFVTSKIDSMMEVLDKYVYKSTRELVQKSELA